MVIENYFWNQIMNQIKKKFYKKKNKKLVIEMKLRDVLKPNLPMKVGGELYGR